MIHVHGGDILLARLRAAGVSGEYLNWCDVVCQGPTPAVDGEAWYRLRAAFHEGLPTWETREGPEPPNGMLSALRQQDLALDAASMADEVVLWFGPELFCQAILLRLLDRINDWPRRPRVTLVCPVDAPEVEPGGCTVSGLDHQGLHAAFAAREEVTARHLSAARETWAAFRASDPRPLASIAASGTPWLPPLAPALERHLAELPAPRTGLSLTERYILESLAPRSLSPAELWSQVNAREPRRWLTDQILMERLAELAGDPALIEGNLSAGPIAITSLGRQVLAGQADYTAIHPVDRWVGGVHLTPGNLWRNDAGRITR